MEKINIAKLLKDCPTGMELNCTSYDNVSFDKISDDKKATYPIFCYITDKEGNRSSISFTEDGCESKRYGAKCVIYPKGKTTWEGFVPPCKFKDGDIVYVKSDNQLEFIIIFKEIRNDRIHDYACFAYQYLYIDKCALCHLADAEIMRLATEEEKEKLFKAIKANGYKWNAEAKTLEKLIVPKFKVGDRIKTIYGGVQYDIKEITDTHYTLIEVERKFKYTEPIIEDKNWELVPNKFDINTLKPFDKVLVRDNNEQTWTIDYFSFVDKERVYPFVCVGHYVSQCIPYDQNKHLLGTTNDCDEYFKIWK